MYLTFDNLMDFTVYSEDMDEQDKVKLGRKYHDELMEFFVAGEKVTEYSSCTLYPTSFTLVMKPLYLSYLKFINETIGGGKNGTSQVY